MSFAKNEDGLACATLASSMDRSQPNTPETRESPTKWSCLLKICVYSRSTPRRPVTRGRISVCVRTIHLVPGPINDPVLTFLSLTAHRKTLKLNDSTADVRRLRRELVLVEVTLRVVALDLHQFDCSETKAFAGAVLYNSQVFSP